MLFQLHQPKTLLLLLNVDLQFCNNLYFVIHANSIFKVWCIVGADAAALIKQVTSSEVSVSLSARFEKLQKEID